MYNTSSSIITTILCASLSTMCYGADQFNPAQEAIRRNIAQLKIKLTIAQVCAASCFLVSAHSSNQLMAHGNPRVHGPIFIVSSAGLVFALQEAQIIHYNLRLLGIQLPATFNHIDDNSQ